MFNFCILYGLHKLEHIILTLSSQIRTKETTMFRIGLFVSGGCYILGSFLWWSLSACTAPNYNPNVKYEDHDGIDPLARHKVSLGISWYLIAFGGVFNVIGSMLSFRNPDERIKRANLNKKRRKQRQSTNMAIVHAATTSLMTKDSDYNTNVSNVSLQI